MRYSRQVSFSKIGILGQKRIERSTIVIVGLGALGSVAAEMLTRSGVNNLVLIDRDIIELSNIQRQSLYTEKDVNKLKVDIAAKKLKEINSKIKIKKHAVDLDYDNIGLLDSDLILDCTDNFYTRFLINDYAKRNNIPWIYCSVIGSQGMTYNILPKGPCFKCLFKEPDQPLGTCNTEGVINTAAHAMAAIQITEALKIITLHEPRKTLLHYNIWDNALTSINTKKNDKCTTCNRNYEFLKGKKSSGIVKLCGSDMYQIKAKNLDINNIKKKLSKIDNVNSTKDCLFFKNMTIFKNGRVLVKEKTIEKAKATYDKYLG